MSIRRHFVPRGWHRKEYVTSKELKICFFFKFSSVLGGVDLALSASEVRINL